MCPYYKTEWEKDYHSPIRLCPGFGKKALATYKLDLVALCESACAYCSSNMGNVMRINNRLIGDWTEKQVGVRLSARTDADKFWMIYPDVLKKLEDQLRDEPWTRSTEAVLQFGMLVDNFSPTLVQDGVTTAALKLLLERTNFKIRILTKCVLAATDQFIELYKRYPGRVTVGMSCGSLDNKVMRVIEARTSRPTSRAAAIRRLQKAGVATFGMFCPILPGQHDLASMEELYAAFNINAFDEIWIEPYNDRINWRYLFDRTPDSAMQIELAKVMSDKRAWARYALRLAQNHADILSRANYKGQSHFLLYESGMTGAEIAAAQKIPHVLFQTNPSLNVTACQMTPSAGPNAQVATP